MQRRPTVGPGSQKAPFRERLPGAISKLGKGTALQGWQTRGIAKMDVSSGWFEGLREMGGWSFFLISDGLYWKPAKRN